MSKSNYNGWSNEQTWNIQMTYEDLFRNICDEQQDQFDDLDDVAAAFEAIIDELEFDVLADNSLAKHAVGSYLNAVDWLEIAEHYGEDIIAAQLEKESQD